ncbi:hypothetical protein ABFV59_14765, partial [Pseudomonas silesiensis]
GLPAKAVCQLAPLLNVPPSSPASRLLHGIGVARQLRVRRRSPVGARLAGESGLSASTSTECAAVFAGKPAPTGFFAWLPSRRDASNVFIFFISNFMNL